MSVVFGLGGIIGIFYPIWSEIKAKQQADEYANEKKQAEERQKQYDEEAAKAAKEGKKSGDALVSALQGINSMFVWIAIGGALLLVAMIAFLAMSSGDEGGTGGGKGGGGGFDF